MLEAVEHGRWMGQGDWLGVRFSIIGTLDDGGS